MVPIHAHHIYIFNLILTLQHFKPSRHLMVEGLWVLNKTQMKLCSLFAPAALQTQWIPPQASVLISDSVLFLQIAFCSYHLICFSVSKDRQPLRCKLFQKTFFHVWPWFCPWGQKALMRTWGECEMLRVLAGTCEFCFCPHTVRKISKSQKTGIFVHWSCLRERCWLE